MANQWLSSKHLKTNKGEERGCVLNEAETVLVKTLQKMKPKGKALQKIISNRFPIG